MDADKLPKILRRFADKIDSISDERPNDGYWVELKKGWISPQDTHSVHEDNPRQCAKMMKWVRPCDGAGGPCGCDGTVTP